MVELDLPLVLVVVVSSGGGRVGANGRVSLGEAEEAVSAHELVAQVVQTGLVALAAHVLDQHHGEGERVQQEHHEHVHHRTRLTVCAVRSPGLLNDGATRGRYGTAAIKVVRAIVAPLQRILAAAGRTIGRSVGRSQAAGRRPQVTQLRRGRASSFLSSSSSFEDERKHRVRLVPRDSRQCFSFSSVDSMFWRSRLLLAQTR